MINKYSDVSLVKRLELKNFRCFTKKIVTFDEYSSLIEGENGIGKTSILEALYYCCYLRSFRTHSPKEMVAFGAEGFFIKIDIERCEGLEVTHQQIQVGFFQGKRRVKIDGKPIASYKELMSFLRVIGLTEDDMSLIKGASQERRVFLDHALVLEQNDYAHQLSILRQIILTRNALLRPHHGINKVHYHVLTEQLWDQSRIIQQAREQYIRLLKEEVAILVKRYFNDEFSLDLTYVYKKSMEPSVDLFLSAHPNLFDSESRMGWSCFGAHQDDLLVEYNEKGSRHFASRGQQKLILLLIKVAQVVMLQRQGLGTIVFLLDDYMTDFDTYRAGVFLKIMQNLNVQLIFTSPTAQSMVKDQNGDPIRPSTLILVKNL
jgi:DNA replication and repair protein RecF